GLLFLVARDRTPGATAGRAAPAVGPRSGRAAGPDAGFAVVARAVRGHAGGRGGRVAAPGARPAGPDPRPRVVAARRIRRRGASPPRSVAAPVRADHGGTAGTATLGADQHDRGAVAQAGGRLPRHRGEPVQAGPQPGGGRTAQEGRPPRAVPDRGRACPPDAVAAEQHGPRTAPGAVGSAARGAGPPPAGPAPLYAIPSRRSRG